MTDKKKSNDHTTPDPASAVDEGKSFDLAKISNDPGAAAAALRNVNRLVTPIPALQPAPNIKFVGRPEYDKAKRKILRPNAPIEGFTDAGTEFALPPADFQKRRRLFYHEAADHIAATFPHLYKIVLKRG